MQGKNNQLSAFSYAPIPAPPIVGAEFVREYIATASAPVTQFRITKPNNVALDWENESYILYMHKMLCAATFQLTYLNTINSVGTRDTSASYSSTNMRLNQSLYTGNSYHLAGLFYVLPNTALSANYSGYLFMHKPNGNVSNQIGFNGMLQGNDTTYNNQSVVIIGGQYNGSTRHGMDLHMGGTSFTGHVSLFRVRRA